MKINLLIVCLFSVAIQASAQIGSNKTSFDPVKHGYKFVNTFETEVINDVRFGGLCGGMVYSALDYYKKKKDIPAQTFRPAVKTPLFNYIYNRQQTSTLQNMDKWTELFVNPFGSRTDEFFDWGLQISKGGRLQELKSEIDKGNPVPLGLFKPGNGGTGPHHQVLAIGYNGGRYNGNPGRLYATDLEITVYDPNYPDQIRTLKPDPVNHIYFYKEDPGNKNDQWMTYFVDKKYSPRDPATVTNPVVTTDDMVKQVLLEIKTGGDDLRGGNDNLNLTFTFNSGATQTFNNVNKGGRWINNYTETVPITLATPVKKSDIRTIVFTTTFGGGIGGDNWNMDAVRVLINNTEVVSRSGSPLYRFTGDNKRYILPMH